jgi:hypothetical protein
MESPKQYTFHERHSKFFVKQKTAFFQGLMYDGRNAIFIACNTEQKKLSLLLSPLVKMLSGNVASQVTSLKDPLLLLNDFTTSGISTGLPKALFTSLFL